jgi:hypothetical protein
MMIARDMILQHILNMFVNVQIQTHVALLGIVIRASLKVLVPLLLIVKTVGVVLLLILVEIELVRNKEL